MNRVALFLLLTLVAADSGCSRKPDPVFAAFVNDEFATNRIVFYVSGRYELYGGQEDGSVQKHPYVKGTYVRSATNYVITVAKEDLPIPDWPARRVYRIVQREGVEYLFDERGYASIKKYEETKDARELRHAWRRDGG